MIGRSSSDKIRKHAKALDDAIETQDIEGALAFFSDRSTIELFGITLKGKKEIRRGILWMYQKLGKIRFQPVTIIVEGNTFFEEFLMKAMPRKDTEFSIKASEVLIFEDGIVHSLRLYLDRMALARILARGPIEKIIVNQLHKMTLKGLV